MQATNNIIGASSLESHAAKQKYPARPMTQPIGYLPTLKTTLQKDKKRSREAKYHGTSAQNVSPISNADIKTSLPSFAHTA